MENLPIKDDPQITAMVKRVQLVILGALDTAILLETRMKTTANWVWTAIGFTLAAIVLTAEANGGVDARNKVTEAYGRALQRSAQKGTKQ